MLLYVHRDCTDYYCIRDGYPTMSISYFTPTEERIDIGYNIVFVFSSLLFGWSGKFVRNARDTCSSFLSLHRVFSGSKTKAEEVEW